MSLRTLPAYVGSGAWHTSNHALLNETIRHNTRRLMLPLERFYGNEQHFRNHNKLFGCRVQSRKNQSENIGHLKSATWCHVEFCSVDSLLDHNVSRCFANDYTLCDSSLLTSSILQRFILNDDAFRVQENEKCQ